MGLSRTIIRLCTARWRLRSRYVAFLALFLLFVTAKLLEDSRLAFPSKGCAFGNSSVSFKGALMTIGDTCLRFQVLSLNSNDTALDIFMDLQRLILVPPIHKEPHKLTLRFPKCNFTVIQKTSLDYAEYLFNWTCDKLLTITHAIDLHGAHWYGGTVTTKQLWPIEMWEHQMEAYATHDSFAGQYGGVMERYWLSSNGIALSVHEDVPLSVGFSQSKHLVLQSKWGYPFTNIHQKPVSLTYTVYQSTDVKSVHKRASSIVFPRPHSIPKVEMFQLPIWSTWMVFFRDVSQLKVLQFADDIASHGFNISQLEIDDKWSSTYGDFEWDNCKFPDPKLMVEELNRRNIPVTLWVHPFASVLSKSSRLNLWVGSGSWKPAFFLWWAGIGYALDVTNPEAEKWYLSNLRAFKSLYGIHSFKFDGGETLWLPSDPVFSRPLQDLNEYTRLYAKIAANADTESRAQEVRVGVRTQNLPLVVRLMDKIVAWSHDNGLGSIIPSVLTYSLLGYPFVLPDIIAGNSYISQHAPSKELFIRWVQLSTFLPIMQFSLPPWTYDEETVIITRNFTRLHLEYSHLIIQLARDFLTTGEPIIRPLWWTDPKDETALIIDSEFLVGNDLLVAPVIEEGATARNVYLPSGRWRDMRGAILEGGKWHCDYRAALHELPYFTRVSLLM